MTKQARQYHLLDGEQSSIQLYTGTYAPNHPYLQMTIDELLDPDFVKANAHLIPACWHMDKRYRR